MTIICWRCHSNSVNTGSRLPYLSDVKTRKRQNMVGIDMIRNNRIVNRIKYTVEQKSMIWICIWNICNLQLRWKFSFDQRIFSFLSEGSSWSLELELPMQSVPNTTILVSWNPAHGEVYMIQNYAIKFVSDLRQVGGCFWVLRFPPPIKLTETWRSLALPVSQPNAWEILLLSNMKVMLYNLQILLSGLEINMWRFLIAWLLYLVTNTSLQRHMS